MAFPWKIISHIVHFYHNFTFTGLRRSEQGKTWRKTSDVTYLTFCSFLLAKSVNPCFHCANFVSTKKLSSRMRLQKQELFQRIKVNVFALWKLSSFPSCCSESHFLLGISKATCWLSNVWFQMKLLLDEATSGWCSFGKPCVFRPMMRSQNNTKKVRKSLFFVFTCWAENSACDFYLFFLKGKTASCVMLHIFIYVQPKDEDMMFFRVYFSSQI